MRKSTRISLCRWLLVAVIPLGAVGAEGCRRSTLSGKGGNMGGGGLAIQGAGGAVGVVGAGGAATGVGGAGGMEAACAGATDPRVVVASQRILRLTMNETLNTVRHLFGDIEAAALVGAGLIGVGDDSVDLYRSFPPLQEQTITDPSFAQLDRIAEHVAGYVLANFAWVTGCPAATDECASAYLDGLATRAYRRRLTPDERNRFTALFAGLRAPRMVNGYAVAFTIEEATSYAVQALLSSPQMLWRWELGDSSTASASPAGIPLTDDELATQLAFFLTDRPPDDTMLAAADVGTLRANLATHAERLLASQAGRDWLRTIMETYVGLNRVPQASLDTTKFPIFSPQLTADLRTEARKFLDDVLWNGNLADLLLSRTAFLNAGLARDIYMVSTLPPAAPTDFVPAKLPADQRSGLLTNAALLTTRSRPDGRGLVVPRGRFVAAVLLCMPPPAFEHPYPDLKPVIPPPPQTAQEEVAARAAVPLCRGCHALFDPYGLALDNYDALGRYRTIDDLGEPVDARATLPEAIGGGAVANGVELAQALATKPAFTNCMANALLQYAMVDASARVDVPLPPQQPGCATADVVQRYESGGSKTFTGLVRATALSPAFGLRRPAP